MEPDLKIDRFRRREIEQVLTAALHATNARLRAASTEEDKRRASEAYQVALRRFADFATKGIVPQDLQ